MEATSAAKKINLVKHLLNSRKKKRKLPQERREVQRRKRPLLRNLRGKGKLRPKPRNLQCHQMTRKEIKRRRLKLSMSQKTLPLMKPKLKKDQGAIKTPPKRAQSLLMKTLKLKKGNFSREKRR